MFGKKKSNQNKDSGQVQDYLEIAEIKDGVVVLKDGSLRSVLAVSSINFDLKSTAEQEAIIVAFQRFLNALDFSIQIVISSRRYDIKPYIKKLRERSYSEKNPLLKRQIFDYIDFVESLVSTADIISKTFYLVVPFYMVATEKAGFLEKLSIAMNPRKAIFEKRELFETSKNQLFQRVGEIRDLLRSIDLRAVPLNTEELIELYYNFYNPSEFDHISLSSIDTINLDKIG